MSLLSMVEGKLPPGFRFHPRDDELLCDYLALKINGDGRGGFLGCPMLIDIDLNKCEPWDLPEMALVGGKEWYFFSLKDRKYATGQRTNRATISGYWKATGKDRSVVRKGMLVGMRKTLVFYQGRAPKGKKTEWVMHEFRLEGPGDPSKCSFKEDWVLCRVFYKSRGICAKPNAQTSYEDTGSSSLPALTESYITFNQTLPIQEGFQQVPCFSSFPPSQVSHHLNPTLASHFSTMERCLPTNLANLGGLPNMGSCLNTLSSDKKVITTVLEHLTRFEPSQRRESLPNLAQGSSESYLSESGLPSVWHPC